MAEPRRRHVPVKRSVRDRWHLPAKTQHVSIPFPLAKGVLMDLGVEELRVMLWIIGDWFWPAGHEREVNCATLAQRTKMPSRNVRRALDNLAERGLIELRSQGKGRSPIVSLKPLIDIGRLGGELASEDRSPRPNSPEIGHPDLSATQVDLPSKVKSEPDSSPLRGLSSDSLRAGVSAGRGESPSSNGHGGGKKTPADIERELAPFLLAEAQAKAAASTRALDDFRKETP